MLDTMIFDAMKAQNINDRHIPSVDSEIIINDWLAVKGFSPRTRFDYTDHLYEHGGEINIVPVPGMEHSVNREDGVAAVWGKTECSEGTVKMPDKRGVGYGYSDVASEGRKRAVIYTKNTAVFWINGTIYEGNRYGYEFYGVPVILEDGINRILVKTMRNDFVFRILPAPSPVFAVTSGDTADPDLIQGQRLDSWISIPVINTTDETIDTTLRIVENDLFMGSETIIKNFAPLSVQKPPIKISTKRIVTEDDLAGQLELKLDLITGNHIQEIKVALRGNNNPQRGYITTYLSATDNSVQQYSVLPPSNFDPNKEYGLILALHGAGVGAGWTNTYSNKDWAYVVGPTNRREFGFDWQDWGRINAFEGLNDALKRFKIDKSRMWLVGHSMGGHGTWSIGLQYPGVFAALGPSAGWLGFDTYGRNRGRDDRTPDKLQEILTSVDRGNSAVNSMENAIDTPFYVLHASEDEVVSVDQARKGVEALRSLGYEVKYTEYQGGAHWWDDDTSEGVSCVDYRDMMDFLKSKTLNPYPKKIRYKVWDLGVNNKAFWVTIDTQAVVFRETKIEAEVTEDQSISVTCENVKQFTLNLSDSLVKIGPVSLMVNGREIKIQLDEYKPVTVHMDEDGTFVTGKIEAVHGLSKSPSQYGPIKAGYFTPFVFVYGTQGGEDAKNLGLNIARTEQYRWWRQGNGTVEIIPDTAVNDDIIKDYNLILYGGPEINLVTGKINKELPVRLESGEFKLGGRAFKGENLAAKFIYPNPLNPEKYVVVSEGNNMEGLRLSGIIPVFFSGSFMPDYVVYDENVKINGSGEFIAAGFFNNRWEIDEASAF